MTPIDKAESWVVAQVRGNTDVTDDKCIHKAINALETHYAFPHVTGGCRKRLDSLVTCADFMSPRGRAVLVACFILRYHGDNRGNMEDLLWPLITEEQQIDRVVTFLSPIDVIMDMLERSPRDT